MFFFKSKKSTTSVEAKEVISPTPKMPTSALGSSTGSSLGVAPPQQRYFHSRRVKKGEVEKPWLLRKDPKEKWVTIIPIIGILLGVAVIGFLVYDGLSSVTHHNYCPLLVEDWSEGFNTNIWTKEAELGGYG